MKKIIALICLLLPIILSPLFAYTPKAGSKERTTILNLLRPSIENELNEEIKFQINDFFIENNWAYIDGEPLTLDGKTPKAMGNRWGIAAIFKKNSHKHWELLDYVIGVEAQANAKNQWVKDYGAPYDLLFAG